MSYKRWMTKHKRQLHERYPYCHWCAKRVYLADASMQGKCRPDTATLDHMYSRLDPRRDGHRDRSVVLACYECNQRRGKKDCMIHFKDEHSRRSTNARV